MRTTRSVLSVVCALAGGLSAQTEPWAWKARGGLDDQIAGSKAEGSKAEGSKAEGSKAEAKLPVYFVMRDRLGYSHWFPRLNGMPLRERRAVVIRELRAHAARTQAALLDVLQDRRRDGQVTAIRPNWLGNFVQVDATVDAVRAAAALPDVWEVWYDRKAIDGCEDTAATGGGPGGGPGGAPSEVAADQVWAMGFTGQNVLVMNADSGININHLALRNQIWANPGEIPGNNIDDDGNGFVDDVNGWNFGSNNNRIDDNGGHGTSTAGVMVASGACNGTTYGIAPDGRVMTGSLSVETSQWAAIQYALQMGADVQTSSHSYKNYFFPSINYAMHRDVGENTLAAGLIRTNSTSNDGPACNIPTQVVQRPFNVSLPGSLPAPYIDANQLLVGRKGGVIGVGAYDLDTGNLSSLSPCGPSAWLLADLNYLLPGYPASMWDLVNDEDYPWMMGAQMGLLKPDITAPTGTLTTIGGGSVCSIGKFGGTSNSTPVVMGCIMLWKSANPSLTPEDVGMIVHQTARDTGSVPGKENTLGAGKVDALAGTLRALAVHRVNGEPAWKVVHKSGTPITFELDGSANRPMVMALGLRRQTVNFGIVVGGIGNPMIELLSGTTDANGDAKATFTVPLTGTPLTFYTQVFLDDTTGPSKRYLASNVIEIAIVP